MFRGGGRVERFSRVLELPTDGPLGRQMFFKQRTQGLHQALYMRSDAHGERAQKVYALDYCAASFVTEGEFHFIICLFPRGWLRRAAGEGRAPGVLSYRAARQPLVALYGDGVSRYVAEPWMLRQGSGLGKLFPCEKWEPGAEVRNRRADRPSIKSEVFSAR